VRVPFFIRWNGKIRAGQAIDTIAAHIDLLPTFAAVAGADLPEGQVEGRDLWPLIKGAKIAWPDRYLFTQQARWNTGSEPDDHQWEKFAVRNQRYRLVGKALFDMSEDPGQKTDVAEQHPEIVAAMRAAYDSFWKEARPLMVNEDAPMSKTRPFHVWYKQQMEAGGIPDWSPPAL
jgi:arylsulfatase